MSEPATASPPEPPAIAPGRYPAAVADAISGEWHRYRWRAYGVGLLGGLFVGGVVAPIVTTVLAIGLYATGWSPAIGVWREAIWSIAFAVALPVIGARTYAGWQPAGLRAAAQTYIWLVVRGEENWRRVFGDRPVPRTEADMRSVATSTPETADTAGARFGLWLGLLEIDRARAAAAQMPQTTATDRFNRAAAEWLTDFVAGTTRPLEPIESLAETIEPADDRLETQVTLALNWARVAVSEHADWQAPLASLRVRLGAAPDELYRQLLWRPVFHRLLIASSIATAVFWIAVISLGPWFPFPPAE